MRRVKKEKDGSTEGDTQPQATDVLIGDEEQNGKQKRMKRKKQEVGHQTRFPGLFRCRDHIVSLFFTPLHYASKQCFIVLKSLLTSLRAQYIKLRIYILYVLSELCLMDLYITIIIISQLTSWN